MKRYAWLALLLAPAVSVLPALPAGEPARPGGKVKTNITWKKTVLDRAFRSEGVGVADVNKDGKMDVVAGEVWYEAPDWKMHVIRSDKKFDPLKYSESFCCYIDDYNGDGWPDVVVVPFPGKACHWYENPRNKPGPWKEHPVWHSACNETPIHVDLFGKGKKVLVMAWQPKGEKAENRNEMAWFSPGRDLTQPWEMHPISGPPADPKRPVPGTGRFSHGLGAGDMNGDGKLDVICTGGWWEQPAKLDGKSWKFHPAKLGDACADMFAFDVDGDRQTDVISTSAHKWGMWWHQQRKVADGKANFVTQTFFDKLVSQTHALHFIDIDGDGLKDLVTGRRWWAHGPKGDPGSELPAYLFWFKAERAKDGMVTFDPIQIDDDSGVGTQFAVQDINGDGLLDVVIANKKGVFIFEQVRRKEDGR
jgi:hypothetical protein